MSSRMAANYFKVLKEHIKRLESSLEQTDLLKVSLKLLEWKIISKEVKNNFVSLDHDHLDPDRKVRYLLQQVCKSVREDDKVYDRLVRVLTRLGGGVKDVCEAMSKELDRIEGGKASGGAEEGPDQNLYESDISHLTEMLVSGSHMWDAIGIALNLPKHKRDDCGEGKNNANRLSNILTTWILGDYESARPASLGTLRSALGSEIVALGKLANKLSKVEGSTECLPVKR